MPECMVCIEVSSQYCVVCVQYVRHTVCYVFLRVGMIGVCSVGCFFFIYNGDIRCTTTDDFGPSAVYSLPERPSRRNIIAISSLV